MRSLSFDLLSPTRNRVPRNFLVGDQIPMEGRHIGIAHMYTCSKARASLGVDSTQVGRK